MDKVWKDLEAIEDETRPKNRIYFILKEGEYNRVIGRVNYTKGTKLFSFNTVNKNISEVKINAVFKRNLYGYDIYERNVYIDTRCLYIQAKNKFTFIRKLMKMGIIVIK